MRIAAIGDLHLGRALYGYDLTPHVRDKMYRFFDLCVNKDVRTAVVLGDVFDHPTPPEHLRKMVVQWFNEFERARINLFVLVGNHDVMSNPESPSALESLRVVDWDYVQVVDRPIQFLRRLFFVPFPSPGLYETIDEWFGEVADVQEVLKPGAVAFTHLGVEGAKVGEQEFPYRGSDYNIPEVMLTDDHIEKIVCGHVHKPQDVGKVVISGAAERLRFDERGDRRAFILINLQRRLTVARVPYGSKALTLRQIELDASGWAHGGTPPTTQEMITTIGPTDVRQAIVKVRPFVDEYSTVDWSVIEAEFYRKQALMVFVAPPIRTKRERKQKHETKATSSKVTAQRFIRARIADKNERVRVTRLFENLRKRIEDDGKSESSIPGVG